jgi:trypsin
MKLSALSIIAASSLTTVSAASIRGSRNLSPAEVPHATSVHKKRSSENDIAEEPEMEVESSSEDGPMSPGLMQTRIIGGGVTNSARFPYAVSIQDNIGHFCGGSLIAADMILTAAHCQGGSYDVVINRHNLDSNSGESIPMAKEFPHPDYNDKVTDGDWMLVKLDRATTQNVPFININYDASKPSPGQEVTVMGWGDTTADDLTQELAEQLMSVTVNAITNEECDASEGTIGGWQEDYNGQITDNMLCARDNGEDSVSSPLP